jgi:hypothetical protein
MTRHFPTHDHVKRRVRRRRTCSGAEDPEPIPRMRNAASRGGTVRCGSPRRRRRAREGPLGDQGPSAAAALRAEVDDPVGGLDDIEVVLDHQHRVALVDQPRQHRQEPTDVVEVEAGRGLVEQVDRVARRTLGELGCELHPLGLTARQRGRRLAESDVAETDVHQRLHVAGDAGLVREEVDRLGDRHVEHVGDVAALELDVERVAVVAGALAHLARDVHVGQEVHLDLDRAVAAHTPRSGRPAR